MSPGHLRASTPEITATTPDGSVTYDNKVCVCVFIKIYSVKCYKVVKSVHCYVIRCFDINFLM